MEVIWSFTLFFPFVNILCAFLNIWLAKKDWREKTQAPNYFIAPTHEQTVYFWKLTAYSVNSFWTSGMGTDNLPKRPEGKNQIKLLFFPQPLQQRLLIFSSCFQVCLCLFFSVCICVRFFSVRMQKQEDGLAAKRTPPRWWKLLEATRSLRHVGLLILSLREADEVSLIAGIMQSSAS